VITVVVEICFLVFSQHPRSLLNSSTFLPHSLSLASHVSVPCFATKCDLQFFPSLF
jgi:hypothetical protein